MGSGDTRTSARYIHQALPRRRRRVQRAAERQRPVLRRADDRALSTATGLDRPRGGRNRASWLHPYMVIEDFELPQMRDWFGLAPDAPPPWPLVARMREHGGVSVLDMSSQRRRRRSFRRRSSQAGAPLLRPHQSPPIAGCPLNYSAASAISGIAPDVLAGSGLLEPDEAHVVAFDGNDQRHALRMAQGSVIRCSARFPVDRLPLRSVADTDNELSREKPPAAGPAVSPLVTPGPAGRVRP